MTQTSRRSNLPGGLVVFGGLCFMGGTFGNLFGGLSSWFIIGGAIAFGFFTLLGLAMLLRAGA